MNLILFLIFWIWIWYDCSYYSYYSESESEMIVPTHPGSWGWEPTQHRGRPFHLDGEDHGNLKHNNNNQVIKMIIIMMIIIIMMMIINREDRANLKHSMFLLFNDTLLLIHWLALFIWVYPQQAKNILWHLINFFFCSGAEHRPERDHDGPRLADDLLHRRHWRAGRHHGQEEGVASGEKLKRKKIIDGTETESKRQC